MGVFSAVGGWDWGHAGTASGRDLGGASAGEGLWIWGIRRVAGAVNQCLAGCRSLKLAELGGVSMGLVGW